MLIHTRKHVGIRISYIRTHTYKYRPKQINVNK